MTPAAGDPFPAWSAALERRHLAHLTFAEVRRALQALSSLYVERRAKLATGAVFEGAGKRAAFAMYYGPLHFLLVRHIVEALGAHQPGPRRILDLGCGTGVSGAAWAVAAGGRPEIEGIDRNPWAVSEAKWTLGALRLRGRVRKSSLPAELPAERGQGILAAFIANELEDGKRERLREQLLDAGHRGVSVLVVEPLSRRAAPWWPAWAEAFTAAGGRVDSWRFPAKLPPRLALLDKAAGLDHRELTGRSLWLGALRGPASPAGTGA